MRVLFVLPAANIYDNQNRVAGWKHTPSSRDELKHLKELVPRLRELGATRVICSDLDGQSGWYLGRRLNVPVEEWQSLRRFNWGKHHGAKTEKIAALEAELQAKWKENPDIPVQGGDSETSYAKRSASAKARLVSVPHPPVVVVADSTTIQRLLGINVKLERCRIYEGSLSAADTQKVAPVHAATAR